MSDKIVIRQGSAVCFLPNNRRIDLLSRGAAGQDTVGHVNDVTEAGDDRV